MKKLLVAALMVVLASPAFAAIQNVKVSGDITTTFVDRNSFDLGTTLGSEGLATGSSSGLGFEQTGLKKQNVFITQTRLRVDADLSDNVSTTVGLINERAWGAEHSDTGSISGTGASSGLIGTGGVDSLDTDVQLYLASLTLREFLYSPLTVTIGRQVFNYGNGLILGDGGVNNAATGNLQFIAQDFTMRTAYDGVTAVLDYKPLTISMIYFKNSQAILTGNSASEKSSSDVFGYNLNYQLNDPMATVFEAYTFARVNGTDVNGSVIANGGSPDKNDTLFVPGLRASTNPIKGLNVQGEVAWQLGTHTVGGSVSGVTEQESEHRDAMAAQFLASYALPVLDKYKPTLNASFTYVSGDNNGTANGLTDPKGSSAKSYSAWDPFNEAQGSGTIYNTIFNLTNMNILALGASVNPLEDVTASFTWNGLWAVDPYTNNSTANITGGGNPLTVVQPDGSTVAEVTKAKATGLGNEYDVNLTYNYTEDVTFGVSLGWYVPGSVFSNLNRDTASQALADVAVKF